MDLQSHLCGLERMRAEIREAGNWDMPQDQEKWEEQGGSVMEHLTPHCNKKKSK